MKKITLTMILASFVTGCVSVASDSAICDATASAVTEHAAALAEDGGTASLQTGDRLIRMIDAACP